MTGKLYCDENVALRDVNGDNCSWWPTHYRKEGLPDYGWVWYFDINEVRKLGILKEVPHD